jgi:hypothetical protein
MINLKQHTTIGDQIAIMYSGPGFYSAEKANLNLATGIALEKVAEEYMNEEDVYQFIKLNGYKVKPYLLNWCR